VLLCKDSSVDPFTVGTPYHVISLIFNGIESKVNEKHANCFLLIFGIYSRCSEDLADVNKMKFA